MFDHILVPTDGSRLGNRAVKAAVKFAAVMQARITFYQALETNVALYGIDGFVVPGQAIESMETAMRKSAQANLDAALKLARSKGVAAETVLGRNFVPWEGIVATARKKKCDVIFMASHGRRGIAGVVLGSVTHQVLTHSKIPVMVFR
jgi:nucleotide-binding universal stress UspA family protein